MIRRIRPPYAAICIFAGSLLAGCSKAPSEKHIIGSMVSWIGTGAMVAQAWLNHATFDPYTRQTLELSAEKLARQSDQLKDFAALHSASIRSPSLDNAVTSARHSMIEMSRLIAAKDAPGVRMKLDSLRAAKRFVVAVSESLSRQP